MKLNNRQQLLTVLALAAVAIWVSDKLILSPLVASWKDRAARIASLRQSVERGAGLLQREASIRRRWDGMRTNALPTEVSAAESRVLRSFDRWSEDSRISITSIKPQWKHDADDYLTLECRVDAAGSLATVTRFLYEIEKDPLALRIEAVEIGARDNDSQQLTLGLQLSGLLLNPPAQ